MSETTIKDAEIFASGKWNGRQFSTADLDGIVAAFGALNLAGRVPLKLGHDGADVRTDDGAPALGWVQSIKRDGSKLLADIKLTSAKLAEGIKSGAYRFVSCELLRNVTAGTRTIPWVLDALAVLGATSPAVGTLKALANSMQAMRRAGPRLEYASRATFSRDTGAGFEELTAIKQQLAEQILETAIASGEVLPNVRVSFAREAVRTPETAKAWIKTHRLTERQRRTDGRITSLERLDPDQARFASDPGLRIVELRDEYAEKHGKDLRDPQQFDACTRAVFKRNPELARAWRDEPGEL